MQQYTVEEPKTPAIERGFEVPRFGDEALLELIEEWQDATPEAVSESFNQYGEDLLESFFERHDNDFGDTHGQRFREYLNALESFGTTYAEVGAATGVSKQLSHLLLTQVVPAVKTTLRAGRRQKQARGGRDPIPGRASCVQWFCHRPDVHLSPCSMRDGDAQGMAHLPRREPQDMSRRRRRA